MNSALQFLQTMYLPGFITVVNLDYSGNVLWFKFNPVEPQVTVLSYRYLTPRGTHICLSQSGYCFSERLIQKEGFIQIKEMREICRQGRLKLIEFNQRFRKEVGLKEILQGKLILTRLRLGKMPVIKFDFDLANRSVTGNMTGVIAPYPVPQTNADILRN